MKSETSPFSLKGKNVYVLGGMGLIGAEVVRALLASGANVVVLDVDLERGKTLLAWAKRRKVELKVEAFDAGDLEGAEEKLNNLVRRHGKMDAWVNASYPRSRDWARKLENMTPAYLRENIDCHLNSYLWLSRVVAMLMRKAGTKGSIVNFASIYGVVANDLSIYEGTAMSGEMLYCGMKAGIINATRYVASYFGSAGIRANCICPGGIWNGQDPVFVKQYEKRALLKRMGNPADIAWPVVFLCASASGYVTGEVLMVDGGWTAV